MTEAWTWRPLKEVTIQGSTWNPRTDPRPAIRYVDVSAISRDELRIISDAEHSAADAPSRARKIVKAGDTIFATIRPTLKRIAQIPLSLDDEIVSTAFCVLRPNPSAIHPDFLYFAMQLECVTDGISLVQTGASYPAVRDADVLNQAVPLPPLSDQYAIATALKLARSAVLCQKRCEDAAMSLKRATMQSLFTRGQQGEAQKETEIGPIPESWKIESVGEHFSVVSGGTPSRRVSDFWTDGVVPWVKTTEIDYCVIHDTEEHITKAGLDRSAAKLLPPGTVLLAMYGQGITRGKVATLGIEAACNQACAALNSLDDVVDSTYLYHFLSSRYEAIRKMAHGGQQQNLNLEIVRNLPLVFPKNKDLQREIVTILEAIDRKIDLHRRKLTVLEELFKALLHKLMTGEMSVGELNLSGMSGGDV